MDYVRQSGALPLVLTLLTALVPFSVQQPSLTSVTVYPFAPYFVVQPSNTSGSGGAQLTPYGAYAFAYSQISQTQINTITLPCRAQSNPAPTYTWKINGTNMQPSAQYSYSTGGPGDLTISPLSPGIYQCVAASGSAIAMSDIVNLTAAYMQIQTPAITNTKTINLGAYYRLPQNPIAYGSFPQPVITWQRDNNGGNNFQFTQIRFDNRVILDDLGRVHITFAQQSDCCDSNWNPVLPYYRLRYQLTQTSLQFTPLLTNLAVATWPSPSFMPITQQYITASPVTAYTGTTVRIVCVYSGTPPIVVNYFKVVNGTNIPIDTSSNPNVLVIPSAELSDSGNYQCQATQTSAPSGSGVMPPQNIALQVLSPPTWASEPSDVFVPIGSQITIPCVATGNPAVTTQWLVNGAVAQNSEDQTITSTSYTLLNAQKPQDNRAVQCVAQNSLATYTANAAITVITPTEITSAPSNQLQIQPDSVVTFSCEAVGDPLLNINITWWWTDINGNIHPVYSTPPGVIITYNKNGSDCQEALTIDTSQFSDKNLVRGSYQCIGSNGWSSANATARLSFYGDADGLVVASFDLWIIGVIIGVLVLIAIIVLIVVCCLRNRGGTYGVDEKERAQGNNPTEDLKRMHGFTEYVRPDSQPTDGSRTGTLQASHAQPAGSTPLPHPTSPEPESDIGEDGSFRGAYGVASPPPGAMSPPQQPASHYAASSPYASTNQAYNGGQPPAPPRSKPPARPPPTAQPDYYQPNAASYENPGVDDSVV